MRSIPFIAAVASFGAGCHSSRPYSATFPDNRLGNYRYLEHVPATSPPVTLQGQITVERDTLIIEPIGEVCRYDLNGSKNVKIAYTCGEVAFTFDRIDPIMRANYFFTVVARVPVTKCIQFTRNSAGQTVCSATREEYEERRKSYSGRLRPQHVS